MLRDEHGLISSYVQAQVANEKKQLVDEQAESRAAADASQASAPTVADPVARPVAMAVIRPIAARGKASVVGASLPVLAEAPPQPLETTVPPQTDGDGTLLARTVGIKDHVISVTQRAVSAIGGIPSWFGAIGDRIGGQDASPRPPANLVSAS
jgi:hypothetical protein